jgi:hypothetical protein
LWCFLGIAVLLFMSKDIPQGGPAQWGWIKRASCEMRAQRVKLLNHGSFHGSPRTLSLHGEKECVAGRRRNRSPRAPAKPTRPKEVAIEGVGLQFFVRIEVWFSQKAGMAGRQSHGWLAGCAYKNDR